MKRNLACRLSSDLTGSERLTVRLSSKRFEDGCNREAAAKAREGQSG